MIFQHFNLLMQKNVIDNICFPLQIQGVKKKEARAKARELLKTVGLEEKEKAYPAQLSGGQKQRVAIARALASNPKILLCDEATSALDPQTTASILELLKSINEQFQITIVIITHQMSVIREICNRVAIIEHGELVENGLVEDIFSHPKSKAARELILRDVPENSGKAEGAVAAQMERIQGDKKLRIVFTENSAFEPVIANMILQFGKPVNILRADTKNVGGVAKGEMILGLPDDRHLQIDMEEYLKEHGREPKAVYHSDPDAHYVREYTFDLSKVEPVVAKPDFVDNLAPAKDVRGIKIDEAFLGSCNNGRIEDLRVGAQVIKGKKVSEKVRFLVVPASQTIYRQALEEGLIDIFMDAGAIVMNPNCSVCWGSCQGVIGENEVLISTGTRNFKGRAGHPSSKVYLGSAATVTASAIAGEIALASDV